MFRPNPIFYTTLTRLAYSGVTLNKLRYPLLNSIIELQAHSKYRTISSITKDVLKVYYNLRTKGEFIQELYYNREFQIMCS